MSKFSRGKPEIGQLFGLLNKSRWLEIQLARVGNGKRSTDHWLISRIPSDWKWPTETSAKDLLGRMTGEPCTKMIRWECCWCCTRPFHWLPSSKQGFGIAVARSIFCLCCCWPRSPSLINTHLSITNHCRGRWRPVRQWQWGLWTELFKASSLHTPNCAATWVLPINPHYTSKHFHS